MPRQPKPKLPAYVNKPAFAFFKDLTGILKITLTKPAKPISRRIVNLVAPPSAKIKSATLNLEVYMRENEPKPVKVAKAKKGGSRKITWKKTPKVPRETIFRPLTEEELDRVVFKTKKISLSDYGSGVIVHWDTPNQRGFTVRDLAKVIAETEVLTRGSAQWLGGVDVHHIFFEGMALGKDGVWRVGWGS